MEEKVLKGKKNGFAMLFLFLALYAGALLLTILSAVSIDRAQNTQKLISPLSILCLVIGIVWLDSILRTQSFETTGSACIDTVR